MTTTAVHPQDLARELDLLAETAHRLGAELAEARSQLVMFGAAFAYLEQAAGSGGLVQIRRPGAATLLTTRVDAVAADVLVAAPTLLECVQRSRDVCAARREVQRG